MSYEKKKARCATCHKRIYIDNTERAICSSCKLPPGVEGSTV